MSQLSHRVWKGTTGIQDSVKVNRILLPEKLDSPKFGLKSGLGKK